MLLLEKKTENNEERFIVFQTIDAVDVQNNPIVVKQQIAEFTEIELDREIADIKSKLAYYMDIKQEMANLKSSKKTQTAYALSTKSKQKE